ncbi:uncharacterized protein EI90DRAFT_3020903 [Cantharellus anzutake]|uniref:uncharacterized protein n=1 Tax=Cantharellus anzutake TaxID=1750568 RepID=UPI001903BA1E|nr:uncharacterized protein EI90DRAFT_3020903 [Cantharellus anzutake]KAF8318936.1 hypothetical protein EI90DRAFT_3020903 [Cantharellus anzutake]
MAAATTSNSPTTKEKLKQGYKSVETRAWKVSNFLGTKMNYLASKVGSEAFYPQPLAVEVEKCSRILRSFTTASEILEVETSDGKTKKKQRVAVQIPQRLLISAKGLAIYTVCRTGLGLSAASGSGVVIARNPDGSWGSPSGILIHTIGFGFLAGADIYDVVLILRNSRAVKAFANPKVSVGGELTVTAGPIGAGAVVDTGIELSPVLSYIKSRGLYGGVQVDGNIVIERSDENARFYGRKIRARQILGGNIERPSDADILVATIESAEGRHIEPIFRPSNIVTFGDDDQEEDIIASPKVGEKY